MEHETYLKEINERFDRFLQHPMSAIIAAQVGVDVARIIYLNGAHAAKELLESEEK